MTKQLTVAEYIAKAPVGARGKLKQLRSLIRKNSPKALEKISYGMPYYGFNGRLAYFRLAKNHIGLYLSPKVLKAHKYEIKDYQSSDATLHFKLDQKIPAKLVAKLIKYSLKNNQSWR